MFARSYTKGGHDFLEVILKAATFLSDACQPEVSVTATPTSNLLVFVHENGVSLIGLYLFLLFISSFLFFLYFNHGSDIACYKRPSQRDRRKNKGGGGGREKRETITEKVGLTSRLPLPFPSRGLQLNAPDATTNR